ncbi:MAG: hypothetical protein E2579_22070 [Pseudomonas sp.]|nr:hypothetical protein [Pseudomonas sp.]
MPVARKGGANAGARCPWRRAVRGRPRQGAGNRLTGRAWQARQWQGGAALSSPLPFMGEGPGERAENSAKSPTLPSP